MTARSPRCSVRRLEETPQATAAVTCQAFPSVAPASFQSRGTRISRTTLNAIMAAAGLSDFPANGLVIGIVRDAFGFSTSGVAVTPSVGTVGYVNASFTGLGGTTTSNAGIFISTDAPFDATWTVEASANPVAQVIGGTVAGRITILAIDLDSAIGQ